MFAELCGFGSGTVDRNPPIKQEDAAGQRCRELALRLCTEVLADPSLGPRLYPVFSAGRENDAHAQLARLIMLLDRLIEKELPLLRRVIRCEARTRTSWQAEATGGRIDFLTSFRRSAGLTPGLWQVQSTERYADSPVNRLLVALLLKVAATLDRVRTYVQHRRLSGMHRERSLFERAAGAIETFFLTSPLSSLTIDLPSQKSLFEEARRRRSEFRRIASFLTWWEDFLSANLERLDQMPEGRTLSVDAAYELIVALSLLLALRDNLATAPGEGLRFRARSGELTARLGAVPLGLSRMRPTTLILEWHGDAGAIIHIFVEARNQTSSVAGQIATYLELLIRQGGASDRGFLFLPLHSGQDDLIHACPIEDLSSDPIGFWKPIVGELFRTLEKHS